jgi:hypothetical protein
MRPGAKSVGSVMCRPGSYGARETSVYPALNEKAAASKATKQSTQREPGGTGDSFEATRLGPNRWSVRRKPEEKVSNSSALSRESTSQGLIPGPRRSGYAKGIVAPASMRG